MYKLLVIETYIEARGALNDLDDVTGIGDRPREKLDHG